MQFQVTVYNLVNWLDHFGLLSIKWTCCFSIYSLYWRRHWGGKVSFCMEN